MTSPAQSSATATPTATGARAQPPLGATTASTDDPAALRAQRERLVAAWPALASGLVALNLWDWWIDAHNASVTLGLRLVAAGVIAALGFGLRHVHRAGFVFAAPKLMFAVGLLALLASLAALDHGVERGGVQLALWLMLPVWWADDGRARLGWYAAALGLCWFMLMATGQPRAVWGGMLLLLAAAAGFGLVFGRLSDREHRLLAEREAQLAFELRNDPLTGVANRRALMERAGAEMARARREGRPLALLLVDVDHMKRINEEHGLDAGDAALKLVAERCAGTVRATDLFGRWSGETFAAILPDTSAEQAVFLGERLCRLVHATPLALGDRAIGLSISVGISAMGQRVLKTADATLDALIDAADEALYTAKHTGRNRVVISSANAEPAPAADEHAA
jgi:diguanylate cyclase (GGDEF)-like protein